MEQQPEKTRFTILVFAMNERACIKRPLPCVPMEKQAIWSGIGNVR
jgi:hypothetical protein